VRCAWEFCNFRIKPKPKSLCVPSCPLRLIWLFLARQFRRRIVNLASADFLHLIAERCPVVLLAGQGISLALVIPAPGPEPLRFRGNEVILFHVLDPQEIAPKFREPVLLLDMEDNSSLEVTPEYARNEYKVKIDAHIAHLSDTAKRAGLDYFLMNTGRPLDEGLREYLAIRHRRL